MPVGESQHGTAGEAESSVTSAPPLWFHPWHCPSVDTRCTQCACNWGSTLQSVAGRRREWLNQGTGGSAQVLETRHCAFVTFAERGAAERAAEGLQNKLIVRGQRCKLCWGRPQQERRADAPPGGAPPPSMVPPQARARPPWPA